MLSVNKTNPINIYTTTESNIPPNKIPPFMPPKMSPNTYYLEMLDIMYKNYNINYNEKKKNN